MHMRRQALIVGTCSAIALALLTPAEASAQPVPPSAARDDNWSTVSDVALVIGVASASLMPRVYYSDPSATAGWKGRFHFSQLAPIMTLTVATVLIEVPIKDGLESVRPGCTISETNVSFPNSGCETFGGPSTHSFAAWSATGAGTGIFLVDTLKYSKGRFNVPGFIGNVVVPLSASIMTSVARGVEYEGVFPHEDVGQIFAGAVPGLFTGLAVGAAYAVLQRPNCGYGGAIFCW
jgi:hypothetical protein